ncbi:MAG: RidA family protein [Bacteroidia bacterium]
MKPQVVYTPHAPAPIGPYSQAIFAGDCCYLSGQIALDPATGQLVDDSVEAEAQQVMRNLGAVLTAAGLDFSHVVKTSIFLLSMDDFATVNAVYGAYFPGTPPARETVAVAGLPRGVRVEISMIAYLHRD